DDSGVHREPRPCQGASQRHLSGVRRRGARVLSRALCRWLVRSREVPAVPGLGLTCPVAPPRLDSPGGRRSMTAPAVLVETASKLVAVDVGGTFTDVVAITGGEVSVSKVPTDVMANEVSILRGAAEVGVADTRVFNVASTAGLNAIIT